MKKVLLFLFAVVVVAAWTLPSYATEVNFDGQWRIRMFGGENADDFQDDSGDTSSRIEQRFRTGITARSSDDFGGYIQLQTNTNDDEVGNQGSNALWDGGSELDVHARQAYLDFNVQNVNFKVGKQYLSHPGDPFKLFLTTIVDAAVVSTTVGPATVYGVYAKLAEVDDQTPQNDEDTNLYALGGAFSPQKGIDLGASWTFVKDSAGPDVSDRHWISGHGGFMVGPVDILAEGVLLTGETDNSNDISAYALAGDATFATDQFEVGVLLGYGSGDDDPADGDDEGFQEIAGSFNQSNLWFDNGIDSWGNAQSISLGNIDDHNVDGSTAYGSSLGNTFTAFLHGKFNVNEQLSLNGAAGIIRLAEDTSTSGDDDVGSELNLGADYTIHSASTLKLSAQANWLFPGDALTGGGSNPDDTVSEYTAKLEYQF
jgi:hypothetical protein